MKLRIEQDPENREVEITIRCGMLDERLEALIRQIRLYGFSIQATLDGREYSLPLETVLYFESLEDKTYAYCGMEIYTCPFRLYELEEQLDKTAFVRVSRSVILNTRQVESVRSLLDGRMEARLNNGEKAMINRHYVPAFKERFGLKGGL